MWKIGSYVCVYRECGGRLEDIRYPTSLVKLAEPVPSIDKHRTGNFKACPDYFGGTSKLYAAWIESEFQLDL